ncbi:MULTISPECIES: helicase-related protein [unclassified Agarivorans]|uniref:helicase-related protein n=1 Tax=unclassified Agarivorans TaxID=2636026 RepID=UPI0026E1B4AF|nr:MULTISPECIES: helicase-related protein [unclassified Agarivorans]MDO6687306.1 helicase-related protein [Agarivorans sp. 3_MG-2023]MDO6716964.1 helicase-related protein [Agarivorans sp. 2_MG-2023]
MSVSQLSPLPIDSIKSAFLSELHLHHLVVEAATGSGKSTRLPRWATSLGKVLVVQPRRIACEALASYVAEQAKLAGEPHKVGYSIRFHSTVNEHTNIAFVTPGIALRWLAENKLGEYAVIIIDEFHERRWDSDLLLALVKQLPIRVVVTSATLEGHKLCEYLAAKPLKTEGREYPVSLSYEARESHHLPDITRITDAIKSAVNKAMKKDDGDILVFLPGRGEIQRSLASLADINAEVLALHATISAEQRRYLLDDSSTKARPRRVILATNVAETSLTIPRISSVIDSGLERRTKQRAGRTVLSLERISRASAEQRKGRAGRVRAGHCYRLWGEFAPLEQVTPPQMQREELLEPMLFAASCEQALANLAFLEALPEKSINIATERLTSMRALTSPAKLSEHGQRLLVLPIDSYFAHLVNLMSSQAEREAMLDLAAALSINKAIFQKPKSEHGLKQLSEWQPLHCDMTLLLDLMRGKTWPEELPVNQEALHQAQELAEQLRSVMAMNDLAEAAPYQRDKLITAILVGAKELVYVRREKRQDAMGNGFSELQIGRESLLANEQLAAIAFDVYSMPGRGLKQLMNIGLCLAPVPIALLAEQQFGELEAKGHIDKQGRQPVQRVYAGRVIANETLAANPEQYRLGLARRLLAKQQVRFKQLSLQNDIDAWNLWVSLGVKHGGGEGKAIEALNWLSDYLLQLGVENAEDLELIEPSDIVFDGIPEWQRSDFEQRFPQHLVLADIKLDVEYLGRSKQVIVHYHSGARKGGPKRWELPNWSGWRIFYKKASKRVALT